MASSNVVPFPTRQDNSLFLCRLDKDWPEEGLNHACLIHLGETEPGDMVSLIYHGYRLISILIKRELDGSIDIRGRSGKIVHLLSTEYEIEGFVER